MQKQVVFLLFLLVSLTPAAVRSQENANAPVSRRNPTHQVERRFSALSVQDRHLGFEFSPGRPCRDRLFPEDLCREMQPIRWTENEISRMKGLLETALTGTLLGTPLGHFHETILQGGYFRILRYRRGSGSAWVSFKDKTINIADSFLDREFPNDQFDLQAQVLLHELAHAFDLIRGISEGREFRTLAGWERTPEGLDYPTFRGEQAPVARINENFLRFCQLIRERRMSEAYSMDRTFGHEFGFPTGYAMTSAHESFAEFFSHAFLDPSAAEFISPALLRFLARVAWTPSPR